MASDLTPVAYESTTKGQSRMVDVHSKDLEHSNSSQSERFDDDYKPSCQHLLENSSTNSTPVLKANINDPVNFIEHTQDDRVSKSSEKHPYKESSFSEETTEEYGSISKDNQTSSVRNSNQLLLSDKANTIQPILSIETKLHEVIHRSASGENTSTEKFQSALPEETELTQKTQPAISEETELTQETEPSISEETGLSQETQPSISEETGLSQETQPSVTEETGLSQETQPSIIEETGLSQETQPAISKKTELTQETQPAISEETESTKEVRTVLEETESVQALSEETASTCIIRPLLSEENVISLEPDSHDTAAPTITQSTKSEKTELPKAKKLTIYEKFNLKNAMPFKFLESSCNKKTTISSSDSENDRIPSNNVLNPSASGNGSKRLSKNEIDLSNLDENPKSSFPPALDLESFASLMNTEEYKNGMHYVFPGKGQVIVTPTTPCEPIFKDFEMPPLSSITDNSWMMTTRPLSPTKDTIVTKDVCTRISLSTMLAMFADWLQRGMDRKLEASEQPIDDDFINYSKRELKYGQNLLKQMNKHIETLIKAAGYLPDPTILIFHELGGERTSIRDTIKYTGMVAQNRLEVLKAEITLSYNRIASFRPNDAKLNNYGFSSKELAVKAQEIFFDSFDKIYDDFLKLSMDIERFRGQIRDFCLTMDALL